MNVLFVIENYFPHIGGVEAVFKNLAEGLAKKGHVATIITHRLKGTAPEETINGVQVKRINCLHNRYLFTFLSIPTAIKEAKKADIIHTTTFNGAFPAWIAAKVTGKPTVITVHEVWIGKWKEYTDMGWLQAFLHNLLERLIYLLKFDKHVAVSESTRKQLLKIGKKEADTTTIYNGVDYNHFNPRKYDGNKIREKYLLQRNYVLLVYGRPGPSKGIEYAITAMKDIIEKIPNAKMLLLLSRDKQYTKKYLQLLEQIKNLGLNDRIINVDPVPPSELPNYIKAADCVVIPSLSEGFGYTAAESAAMGKPVVASNTTSLPEVVSGKYVLVKPRSPEAIAAAVEKLKGGKVKAAKLKRFTIEDNVNGYLKVYLEVLGR